MSFDSFEKQWQDRLKGASIPPDPAVWQRLSGQLAAQQASRRRRRGLILWWGGLGAALLLGLGVWAFQKPYYPDISAGASAPLSLEVNSGIEPVCPPTEAIAAITDSPAPQSQSIAKLASLPEPSAHTIASQKRPPATSQQMPAPASVEPASSIVGARESFANTESTSAELVMGLEMDRPATRPTGPSQASIFADLSPLAIQQFQHVLARDDAHPVSRLPMASPRLRRLKLWVAPQIFYEAGRLFPNSVHQGVDGRTESFSLLSTPQDSIGLYRMEFARSGLGLQGGLSWQLNRQWSVGLGIEGSVSSRSTYTKGLLVVPVQGPSIIDQFVGPVEVTEDDVLQEVAETLRAWQLGVPVQLKWHPQGIQRGWQLGLSGGLTYSRNPVQRSDANQPAFVPVSELDARNIYTHLDQTYVRVNAWHAWSEGTVQYGWRLPNGTALVMGPYVRHFLTAPYSGLAAPNQMRYRVGWRFQIGLNR